jgi:hypothetical protein
MRCITPITIKNDKPRIGAFRYHKVPCGKCPNCRKSKSNTWQFRLMQEYIRATTMHFVTLTYNDENVPYGETEQTLHKKDLQNFIKRLRKSLNTKIKYYAVGEYGTKTERPHYHAIIYNIPEKETDKIAKAWGLGNTDTKKANGAMVRYCTQYLIKRIPKEETGRLPEFALMSKRLGDNWLSPHKIKHYKEKLVPHITETGGNILPMPRYYRDKIYNETEKRIVQEKGLAYQEENYNFDESGKLELDKVELVILKDKLNNNAKRITL